MRRSLIVVLALTFTLILTLTGLVVEIRSKRHYYGDYCCYATLTFPTEGGEYYGYGEFTDHIGQVFKVWITVDTRLNKIDVKWEGHIGSAVPNLPAGQHYITFVRVYDDEGYSETEVTGDYYGTNHFNGYTHNHTWVHAKLKWWYQTILFEFYVECIASVHIEE